jgi:hypothetical protein
MPVYPSTPYTRPRPVGRRQYRAKLIDYVFHTPGLRPGAPAPSPTSDDTKLPSGYQPSDHLALVVA